MMQGEDAADVDDDDFDDELDDDEDVDDDEDLDDADDLDGLALDPHPAAYGGRIVRAALGRKRPYTLSCDADRHGLSHNRTVS